MKKKILSFVLMICILSSFFTIKVIAAGDSEMPVSISLVECYYAESKIVANITFDYADEDGNVILAIYDGGKFVTANQKSLSAGDSEKTVEITDVDESYIGYEAKVFCWDGDNRVTPISASFETQVAEKSSSGEEDGESELIIRLRSLSAQIEPYLDRKQPNYYTVFNSAERYVLKTIKPCIDDAVETHYDVLNSDDVDPDFIENTYKTEIDDIRDVVYNDMTEDDREAFKGKLAANFDEENLMWLADTLGIDVSQYYK